VPRYVALLRGVSPLNASMPDLKRSFEAAGFTQVKTLLSSGNVVFDAGAASESAIARKATAAMEAELGRSFMVFLRRQSDLQALLAADPFAAHKLSARHKRVVTFLLGPPKAPVELSPELDGARILGVKGREVFCAYVPGDKGPVFMKLIEKTFSKEVTTRTWDTVRKCAEA
jgi:uncharacterized protein (DUF1697 family)